MKKIAIALTITMITFSAAFAIKANYKKKKKQKKLSRIEYNIGIPSEEIHSNLPFVVLITSYNNQKYCEKNLRSALDQEYDNYRIIYIDDHSTDRTYEVANSIIESHPKGDKITLIRNEKNLGSMANLYHGIHSAENHEIIVTLDGDDAFAHTKVLNRLNAYYQNPDVWLTYGSYLEYPSYRQGIFSQPIDKKILKEGSIKRKAWMTSHLRTFYAGLFKRIPMKHFIHKGRFLDSASDIGMMIPMIEMAREHVFFIPEILYIYTQDNPLNDTVRSSAQQEYFNHLVRSYPVLSKLTKHPKEPFLLSAEDKADILVFSYNRPLQLLATLESIEKFVSNYANVFILYRASDEHFQKSYNLLKQQFPNFKFFQQPNTNPHLAFKPMVLDLSFNPKRSQARYIAYCTDDIIVKDEIDFLGGILSLKETQAYGLYYRLGRHVKHCFMFNQDHNIPNFISFKNDIKAWQFASSNGDFNYPHSIDFTLFKKEKIKPTLQELNYTFPNPLEAHWAKVADSTEIGLCYTQSKIVNIPLNIVSEYTVDHNRHLKLYTAQELQDKFDNGYKIDISDLYKIENISAHMEYEPKFIKR